MKKEIIKTYFRNHNLYREIPYCNGKIQGMVKYYYDNGEDSHYSSYKNGFREGLSIEFLRHSIPFFIINYKLERIYGIKIKWYINDFLE